MIPVVLQKEVIDLKEVGYQIQLKEVGNKIYVIFNDYPLPKGYNLDRTDLLVFTCSMYPSCPFDMFWVDKTLILINGVIPKASTIDTQYNQQWRRYSIHPYNNNKWNPSEDSLSGFLSYINKRLNELI